VEHVNHDVESWFIPVAEPWRNGVIEKFNDHYHQKFLNKTVITTDDELAAGSFAFEQRHNCSYRYSKLGGKTPLKALKASTKNASSAETMNGFWLWQIA
jgi:putative transposase